MSTPTKGFPLRVWIPDPILERLDALSKSSGIPRSGLAAKLISAALSAIENDGEGISFPLVFQVIHARSGR